MGTNRHFDFLAPFYDRLLGNPSTEKYQFVLNLTSSSILLDCGGGTGRIGASLKPFVGMVVVLDESLPMLRQAKRKRVEALQAAAEDIPLRTHSVDAILVSDAFHHFAAQEKVVEELVRVLKPGGPLVVEEPDIHRFPVKMIYWMERISGMRTRFRSPEEIGRMLQERGLKVRYVRETLFRKLIIGGK